MGIYPCKNTKIYGIYWTINNSNVDNYTFEKRNDMPITNEEKQSIIKAYNNLTEQDKNNLIIKCYIECFSTLEINDDRSFLIWYPISKNFLEEYLNLTE